MLSCSVMSDSVAHMPGTSVHGIFQAKKNWSELPFSTLGDLPDPGIKPVSPALAGGFFITWEAPKISTCTCAMLLQYIPPYKKEKKENHL